METKIRLAKRIQQSGNCSRRKAEELIEQKKVKVNGLVVSEQGTKVSMSDEIEVNGEIIGKKPELIYLLLNKDIKTVSTRIDEKKRKTVLTDLPVEYQNEYLWPVGRLDWDTTGALLLTNDGVLTNKLTHPKNEVKKQYLASLKGIYNINHLSKLLKGIKIENDYLAKPDNAEIISTNKATGQSLVSITIHEGKNHEVKNIFKAQGFEVLKLHRAKFAFLTVEGQARGTVRALKKTEVKKLYAL